MGHINISIYSGQQSVGILVSLKTYQVGIFKFDLSLFYASFLLIPIDSSIPFEIPHLFRSMLHF